MYKTNLSLNMTVLCFLGASEQSAYKRNASLDQKISLYSGDITKLEIDAIVNAGMRVCVCVCESESISALLCFSHNQFNHQQTRGTKERAAFLSVFLSK